MHQKKVLVFAENRNQKPHPHKYTGQNRYIKSNETYINGSVSFRTKSVYQQIHIHQTTLLMLTKVPFSKNCATLFFQLETK